MKKQGKQCRERLEEGGLVWKSAKRRRNVATPIVVPSMNFGGVLLEPIFRKPPFIMDCHLAESLLNLGPDLLELGVAKLRFSSIHDFRRARTGGTTKKSLSRHAYGLAVDVYEVEMETGARFAVKTNYGPTEEPEAVTGPRPILKEVERVGNESKQFRLLLTPANDPKSHYDHFHLEAKVAALASAKEAKRKKARRKRRDRRRRKRRRR